MSRIDKSISVRNIEINGNTYIKGNIIPTKDSRFNIGAPQNKVKDMFISDNSLWIGDTHKLSISSGEVKFRKRLTDTVPPAIIASGGTEQGVKTYSGKNNLRDITLNDWEKYMKTLSNNQNKTVNDIFRDNDNDYSEDNSIGATINSSLTTHESITYTVTVATKTNTHRYYDHSSGSNSGYLIDGKSAPYIDMIPGKTYRFDQSDSTNNGHPIKFYTTADKSEEYTTDVKRFSSDSDDYANYDPPGTGTEAYVEIVVSSSTPALLFYQCQYHNLMGNQIQVKGVGSGGLTIKEEGKPLTTTATSLNFIGTKVTAHGDGEDKIITLTSESNSTYTNSLIQSNDDALLRLKSSTGEEQDIKLISGNNIALQTSVLDQKQLGDNITPSETTTSFGKIVKTNSTGTRILVAGDTDQHVRAYELSNGSWTQLGNNMIAPQSSSKWGHAIDMNSVGDIVAITAIERDESANDNKGSVSILKYDGTNWNLRHNEIYGEDIGDEEGMSVSLNTDGTKIAISTIQNDDSGVNAGQVRIFEDTGTTWSQIGNDVLGPSDTGVGEVTTAQIGNEILASHRYYHPNDNSMRGFGYSVAMNATGNRIIVGEHFRYDHTTQYAFVYEYSTTNNEWSQLGSNITEANDGSGAERIELVDMNDLGDIIAVANSNYSSEQIGAVKVMKYDGSDWQIVGNTIIGNTSINSISLNGAGNIIATNVGTYEKTGTPNNEQWTLMSSNITYTGSYRPVSISLNNAGNVLVYNTWRDPKTIFTYTYNTTTTTWTNQNGSQFVNARNLKLNASGNRMVVYRWGDSNHGSVTVYEWNDSTTQWEQLGNSIIDPSPSNTYRHNNQNTFGEFLAINDIGDKIAVGSEGALNNYGRIRMFSYSGGDNGVWTQFGNDIVNIRSDIRYSKCSRVAFNSDGTRLIVGCPGPYSSHDGTFNANDITGYVMIWSITDTPPSAHLGRQVALNGDGNILAVSVDVDNESNNGHVRIYKLNSSNIWNPATNILRFSGANSTVANFGRQVRINNTGDIIAISSNGNVYVYKTNSDWLNSSSLGDIVNEKIEILSGNSEEGTLTSYGSSIAISDDGTILAVGADEADFNGVSNSGLVKFYRYTSSNNTWNQFGSTISIPTTNQKCGAVDLDSTGLKLIMGCPSTNGTTGLVQAYNLPDTTHNAITINSQRAIDFTAFTETAERTTSTTLWWEVFGPTSSALAECSGIVPQTLTSKMHIMIVIHLSGGTIDPYFQGILYRNVHVGTDSDSVRSSTPIGINTESGDFLKVSFTHKSNSNYGDENLYQENISYSFVDDLTSSGVQVGDKVTYSVKVRNRNDSSQVDAIHNTIRINRFGNTPNLYNYSASVSTLTVVEY